MRRLRWIFPAFLALLLASTGLHAEGPYLLVRVEVTPEVKVLPLLELGLDIASGVKDQYVDVVCFPEDLARIRGLGYLSEVLIPDMERFYRERAVAAGADTMGGFLTWSEMVAHIDTVHAHYPNITTAPWSIGNTIQGRPMHVIKISDNPDVDEDEAEIFFNGVAHGREPIGMAICLALIDQLTSRYGIDPQITDLVNNREIFVLPVLNVDGYVYNQQTNPNGGGMWRKNRRLNAGGSYGVDLNRNFGFLFGLNNIGSSGTPSSETYRGTAAFSEPETENVRQFCNSRYFGIAQNFHSFSDLMLYSWSNPPPAWGYTPDNATFEAMSLYMQQWTGYTYGPPWEILYEVNGDANDWMYGEQGEKPKIMAWVFEVGSSFWPSPSLIPGLIAENIQPALYMIDQAVNFVPLPVSLAYISGVIDDQAGGNGNGGLDPGESVTFTPTLRNNGWVQGTGISATLSTGDPYITITTSNAAYPNLDPHTQGASNTPYAMSVSSSCPLEHNAQFGLTWTCAQGYSDTEFFNLMVGDPMYQPLGPDGYGYYAYDVYDEGGPIYNWIEVDPAVGGPGTLINFTADDQTFQFTLPFTFQYYGQDYTQISVCSNGWIAMGSTTDNDWSNSAIPNADGPPAMVAPFWEDLSPQLLGRVAYYYNAAQHYYAVEFDSVRQYTPTTARETFEVILYDPNYYSTLTGDGQILMQYQGVSDPTACTVGIENEAETIGLQVLFDSNLNSYCGPLQAGQAILFTTSTAANASVTLTPSGVPIEIPPSGGSFDFNIAAANLGTTQLVSDVWCDVTLPNGAPYGPVLGPVQLIMPAGFNLNRDRAQAVPGSAPSGTYSYNAYIGDYPNVMWDTDSFAFVKLASGFGSPVSEWSNWGESLEDWGASVADQVAIPDHITLSQNYPNPFNPVTNISYGLPEGGFVSLKVCDLLGREVAVLLDGYRSVGVHQVSWDASRVPSGLYLYVLRAGDYAAANKCLLIK